MVSFLDSNAATLYSILGVSQYADGPEIQNALQWIINKEKTKIAAGEERAMRRVNLAMLASTILMDQTSRKEYDECCLH